MDILIYNAVFYALMGLAVFSAYSSHKVLAAIVGVGFIILGVFLLTSPLQYLTGEVLVYAS